LPRSSRPCLALASSLFPGRARAARGLRIQDRPGTLARSVTSVRSRHALKRVRVGARGSTGPGRGGGPVPAGCADGCGFGVTSCGPLRRAVTSAASAPAATSHGALSGTVTHCGQTTARGCWLSRPHCARSLAGCHCCGCVSCSACCFRRGASSSVYTRCRLQLNCSKGSGLLLLSCSLHRIG
jgi:hypothetical protein